MKNDSRKKNGHARFYCLLMFLLGLCFLRYALQINFPRTLLLIVVVMVAVMGDQDEIIAMMICCIPLDTSINFFFALIICLAVFVLKYHKDIYVDSFIVPILLMIIWELLHCLGKPFSPMTLGTNFVSFLVLAVLACHKRNRIDYSFICRALSICIILVCFTLIGKILYVTRFNFQKAITNLWRLGADTFEAQKVLTIDGGHQNPNTLGILCILGMTGLLQLRRMGEGKKSDIAQIVILMVFGALTSSRTYLVCLAIMIVLFWIGQEGRMSNKVKLMLQLVLFLAVALLILYIIFPSILEYYFNRLVTKDKYATREDLMNIYHSFIINHPKVMFWGIGLHNYYKELMEVYRVASTVPHNAIQEMVIAWGLMGIVLFMLLGIAMIINSRRFCKNQRLINYIPVIIIIAKSMVGQLLDSPYTLLTLSYCYLSMCEDFTQKREITQ